jgi:flagellar secretion chaperone FliS
MFTEEALHKKTPEELTALLYEAFLSNLEEAKEAIVKKEMIEANTKLQKANDILYRLGAGLNYEAGIIADQLDEVYNYLAERLIQANLTKEVEPIDEAIKLVTSISEAWNDAMEKRTDSLSHTNKQKNKAYEQFAIYE